MIVGFVVPRTRKASDSGEVKGAKNDDIYYHYQSDRVVQYKRLLSEHLW